MELIPNIIKVKNLGYYTPPHLKQHRHGVLRTRNEIVKQGRVSLFHGGFILPCGLITPNCFHCNSSYIMVRFLRCTSLLSRMSRGSGINSPSGSTCSKDQSITCLVSYTYFFNKYAWKTLWTFIWASKANLYADGPLLASISKGPWNIGANFPHLPKLNELLFNFTFK